MGKWKAEELEYLKQNIGKVRGIAMARHLNRPYKAVAKKVRGIGMYLGRAGLSIERKGTYRPCWTAEQDQYIRDHASEGAYAIGKALERSVSGVNHRAQRIGVSLSFVPRREALPLRKKASVVTMKARPTHSSIEFCKQCGAPVSNWVQHYERLGHR